MQTYPVFFHDWQGTAYRNGGHFILAPKHLSDHLSLSWKTQYRKIMTSDLKEGMALRPIPGTPLRGVPSMVKMTIQSRETVTLKLPYFGAWVLSINTGMVPIEKRPLLVEMKRGLLDALERQLGQMFGLPLMEVEDFLKLPMPPIALSQMEPADCVAARVAALSNPQAVKAAQMIRIGLPASKVAPLVNRSIYWARQTQRHLRRIGLVPLPPAQQRLLDQPSLFGGV